MPLSFASLFCKAIMEDTYKDRGARKRLIQELRTKGIVDEKVLTAMLKIPRHFFIQSEWKGGFISMPDIRTTMHKEDRASQHFLFSQYNVVFGANFRIPCKKNPND